MTKKHKEVTQQDSEAKEEGKASSRRVFLFGRLENEVALPTIKRLLRLNDRDAKTPIDLYINSAGGNGYNADAIIAVIHSISAPVNTICLGHALSGACEILASGTGERSSYEFATLMFHQTLWEADGDITNLEIQAAQGLRFREAQIELLHRCTGKEKTILRKDIERDYYLSAHDALGYGIIDKVICHSDAQVMSLRGNHAGRKPAASKARSPLAGARKPSNKTGRTQSRSTRGRTRNG